jgi:5-methylcytosine-specific restriction enzyme subunit McrC
VEQIYLYEWQWTELPASVNSKELKEYLAEVWATRNILYEQEEMEATEEDESDISRFSQGFLRFDEDFIGAKNYVGFIRFNDVGINIFPKIFSTEIPTPKGYTEYITSNILHWLRYSMRIKFPFSEVSFEEQKFHDFLEPFIFIFAEYTNDLLEVLPYQHFEEITEPTTFIKGRLATKEYIKESLITGNYQRIISTYEPFQFDNRFNQIIKCVCKLLLIHTSNTHSIERLQNILFTLDEVEDKLCTTQDCNSIHFSRIYIEWNSILNMCRMFLSNHSFKAQNIRNPNFCFLVPMELVYEEYVAGVLKKYSDKKVLTQGAGRRKYLTEEGLFLLKPDIIYDDSIIIDTKYKLLDVTAYQNNFHISQLDLYQMFAYALRHKISEVILLYPCGNDFELELLIKSIKQFSLKEEFNNTVINIKIVLIAIINDWSEKQLDDFEKSIIIGLEKCIINK